MNLRYFSEEEYKISGRTKSYWIVFLFEDGPHVSNLQLKGGKNIFVSLQYIGDGSVDLKFDCELKILL